MRMLAGTNISNFWKCHLTLFVVMLLRADGTTAGIFERLLGADETAYEAKKINLPNLSKLNNASALRYELNNHIKYVQEIVQFLDDWAFEEIQEITKIETLNKQTLKSLEEQMLKIQNNAVQLALDLSENVNDTKSLWEKYSRLQNDLDNVNQQLNNKTCESIKLLQLYFNNNSFPNIISNFYNLSEEVSVLYKNIIQKEETIKSNLCIAALKRFEYTEAVYILNSINNDKQINYIVKKVYNGDLDNFHKVLKFGDKIRNITKSFLVYKALNNEIDINNHINEGGNEYVKLIKSLKKEIIDQIMTTASLKTEAINLEKTLKNKLKFIGKQKLMEEVIMKDNNEDYYSTIDTCFLQKLLVLDAKLLANICNEVFSEITINPVQSDIYVDDYLETSFTEFFDQLIKENTLDGVRLTYFFKTLQAICEEESLMVLIKSSIIKLKASLPTSVKNVEFAETVCIYNYGVEKYLHVANKTIQSNKYAVISIDSKKKLIHKWKIERSNNELFHISSSLQYSYLSTDDDNHFEYYKADGRFVYLWYKNEIPDKGIWQIIPSGDYCYIKNVEHREYLYISEETNYYAFIGAIGDESDNWKWFIEDCTDNN